MAARWALVVMTRLTYQYGFLRRQKWRLTLVTVAILALLVYTAGVPNNPAGFYIDESSIAYNAHTISLAGQDEWGVSWPLYFRAFGDYKNPVYIYILAAIFRATGPSILVARLFSASLGILTVAALGLLAVRISNRRVIGLLVGLTALLTPWLFELSRVALEVAMYPLALAAFLTFLHHASEKLTWSWTEALYLATSLTLLTYTYSIGRLFAPLLALGLAMFFSRARALSLLLTWAMYVVSLGPLVLFHRSHPGALTSRFQLITFVSAQSSYTEIVGEFAKHYLGNFNPWLMLVTGDPNRNQIVSIYGVGPMLAATFVLAVLGICLLLRRARPGAWWGFVFYGLAVSVVPASLTKEYFHILRLAAVPVFLIVLSVPALAWLSDERAGRVRRGLLVVLIAMTLLQGAIFQRQYHQAASSAWRRHLFDADYPGKILPAALNQSSVPVYLADALSIPGYIQALWYATLQEIPLSNFVRLPPDKPAPEGAVVITTEVSCPRCRRLAASEPYTVYIAEGPPRIPAPLTAEAFQAELGLLDPPRLLRSKEQITVRVMVKNASPIVWYGRERGGEPFQVSLGNHWLDSTGRELVHDDGRTPLLSNLRPGEETELLLAVNGPNQPGAYKLEIDMLQEGVTWFGLKGSRTLQLPVKVESR